VKKSKVVANLSTCIFNFHAHSAF